MEEYTWGALLSMIGSAASITSLTWAGLVWLQKRKAP